MSEEFFEILPTFFFTIVMYTEAQGGAVYRLLRGRTSKEENNDEKMLLILLSLAMVFSMAARGQKGNGNKGKTDVTATPAEIEQKIAEAIGKDNYLCDTNIDKDWLQNSYQLDMSKIESYVAKQNSIASVNVDTVIVLKVKDGYADEAVKALNDNYSQLVSYIRQYPFGTAKVLSARLYQSGNYIIYVVAGASYDGEDSEAEAKLAVSEYAKIDEAIKGVFGTLPENLAVVPEDDGNNGGLVVPDDSENDTPVPGG